MKEVDVQYCFIHIYYHKFFTRSAIREDTYDYIYTNNYFYLDILDATFLRNVIAISKF